VLLILAKQIHFWSNSPTVFHVHHIYKVPFSLQVGYSYAVHIHTSCIQTALTTNSLLFSSATFYQVTNVCNKQSSKNNISANTLSNQILPVTLPAAVVPAAEFSTSSFHLQTAQYQTYARIRTT